MATSGSAERSEADDRAVDAAFAEVRAAEAAAEAAVLACGAEAEQRLAQARAEASALAERSRQKYLEWCCRQAAGQTQALAALDAAAQAAAQPVALDGEAAQRLALAVERLADELCGQAGNPE